MKPPAPADSALLFAWEKPRGFWTWLPLFVLLSLLAHAATFFVFRVVYPARASLPPVSPQITVLLPTPENAAFLRWIEAEDPALIATAQPLVPPGLVKAEYRASYEVIRTAPRGLAEPATRMDYPSERSPLSIIRSGEPAAARPAPAHAPQPTALVFSGGLAQRALTRPAALHFTKSPAPLAPARFLLGVTDRGEVRYVFPQDSSGHSAIDAEAAAAVSQLSFAPADAPIAWGFATVQWGNDAYAMEGAAPSAPGNRGDGAPRSSPPAP